MHPAVVGQGLIADHLSQAAAIVIDLEQNPSGIAIAA